MNRDQRLKEAQERVLAYMFSDKHYIALVIGQLEEIHWPNYSFLYRMLLLCFKKYKIVITDQIVDQMFAKKNLGSADVIMYKSLIGKLRGLLYVNGQFTGSDGDFQAFVDELIEHKMREDWLRVSERILEVDPHHCPSTMLEQLQQEIGQQISRLGVHTDVVSAEGLLSDTFDDDYERYNNIKTNPEAFLQAIPSGWKAIDAVSGGWRRQELVIFIGRKGGGKSVALVNLGIAAQQHGYNVLIFTLEIPIYDYRRRVHACTADISANGLKMGNLTSEEELRYKEYGEQLKLNKNLEGKHIGKLYVVDVPKRCNPAFIETKLEELQQRQGVKYDVIIVDYMGIMAPNYPIAEKRLEQGEIALQLKQLARSHDCVVMSAAQMNREGARAHGADSLNVANSDAIADHIDWGFEIRSSIDNTSLGIIESFKVRDDAPVLFKFQRAFEHMRIIELASDGWEQL